MKVGDVVMFTCEGIYAKWFYGKLGICEKSTPSRNSCRVRWLEPVKYFDGYTTYSDFGWERFEVYDESG